MIQRGRRANEFLQDPLFAEVLLACKDKFTQRWLDSEDEATQKAQWAMVHALAEIEHELRAIVGNGMMEQDKLQRAVRANGR